MNTLSLIWGILSVLTLAIGFFPCLGALNWFGIPFSFVGAIISIVAYFKSDEGKGKPLVGIIGCSIGVVFGVIRLVMGGGVL